MTKSRSAALNAPSRSVFVPPTDATASALDRLGPSYARLMERQAEVAIMAMVESSARYAANLNAWARHPALLHWQRAQRSNVQSLFAPLRAWVEAVAGLQTVMWDAFIRASERVAFADPAAAKSEFEARNRRVTSVVIPFPDRRTRALRKASR